MKTNKVIRNAAAYNSMLAEIKAVMASEEMVSYKVAEDRNATLYGGTECYDHTSIGAYTYAGRVYEFEYANTIGTISSEGNLYEEEIPSISKDIALRTIKSALKEAFTAPEFVGNDEQCPSDDDGMWWNNHRLIPSTTVVEVNHHIWYVSFQD